MTLHTALQQGTRLLEEGAILAPRLTAEVLLCHAAPCSRTHIYSHPEEELTENGWLHYGRFLHQRLQGTPTQYITKRQEFYGRDFFVSPAVLIPRPETEHLVETALRHDWTGRTIIDVGTGSGAIGITFALETKARVFASDLSGDALAVACRNRDALQAEVHFTAADLLAPFAPQSFDLVVCNPPYIPLSEGPGLQREVRDFEPPLALFGGAEGTEPYFRLIAQAEVCLRPGGWLMVELGYRSLSRVQGQLGAGWTDQEVVNDLAGFPRVLAARWQP